MLVLFYHEVMGALTGLGGSAKLLLIKGLVFATWWQGLVVSGMATLGWIQATKTYTVAEISSGLQDFLIVIEMMLFAVAFHFHFGFTDALPPRLRHKARETQLCSCIAQCCFQCCPREESCYGLAGQLGCAPEEPSLDPEEAEFSSLRAERDAVDYILRGGEESTAVRALADMVPADVFGNAGGYLAAPVQMWPSGAASSEAQPEQAKSDSTTRSERLGSGRGRGVSLTPSAAAPSSQDDEADV